MAYANPQVDEFIDDYDLESIPVCEPHQQTDFDEWLMNHSLEQLFDAHSSIALRWQIIHWIFTIPFVSRTYGDPCLRSVLESAVARFRESIEGDPSRFDKSVVFSVKVESLDLDEVAFCITEQFDITPHPYSYEAVCMRLQVDPDVFRDHVRYQMRRDGIWQLIEENQMAVASKTGRVTCNQIDMFGPVDYSDLATVIKPITVSGLHRHKAAIKTATTDSPGEDPMLFDFSQASSILFSSGS